MKSNVSYFLHKNKVFFVCLMLAVSSLMPCKSYSNELNKASEGAIVSYCQNISEPDSAEAWYIEGHFAYLSDQYDEAIKCYEKAIELNPNHARSYSDLGQIYHGHKKDYDKAIKYCNKWVEIHPTSPYAYWGLGNVYQYGKKDYDEATKYYNKAIELDADFAFLYRDLGDIYKDIKKDYDNAIKCYAKAIELYPECKYTCLQMGMIYVELGHKEAAIEWLNAALRLEKEESGR